MLITLSGLLLGLLSGLRHAFEPDHLAAVSTLVADRRGGRPVWLGVAWGAGHTLTLLVAGGVLILLRARMPLWLEDAFELLVAVMLVALGARGVLMAAARRRSVEVQHAHDHSHADPHVHSHAHAHPHAHAAVRPLSIGLVHGLAGSGALAALVAARLDTVAASAAFMALFGVGSAAGMAALTGLLGWPLSRMSGRGRVMSFVLASTGALSFAMGIAWGAPLVARHLF